MKNHRPTYPAVHALHIAEEAAQTAYDQTGDAERFFDTLFKVHDGIVEEHSSPDQEPTSTAH